MTRANPIDGESSQALSFPCPGNSAGEVHRNEVPGLHFEDPRDEAAELFSRQSARRASAQATEQSVARVLLPGTGT